MPAAAARVDVLLGAGARVRLHSLVASSSLNGAEATIVVAETPPTPPQQNLSSKEKSVENNTDAAMRVSARLGYEHNYRTVRVRLCNVDVMSKAPPSRAPTHNPIKVDVAIGRGSVLERDYIAVAVARDHPHTQLLRQKLGAETKYKRHEGGCLGVAAACRWSDAPERLVVGVQDAAVVLAAEHHLEEEGWQDPAPPSGARELYDALSERRAKGLHTLVVLDKPFDRLGYHASGHNAAAERCAAVRAGRFFMYPAEVPNSEDSFAVRWVAPGTSHARHELFLDYGVDELKFQIERRAALGGGAALVPEALSRDDPVVFWQCVWRHKHVYKALAAASGSLEYTEGEFRIGTVKAAHEAKTDGGKLVEKDFTSPAELKRIANIWSVRAVAKAYEWFRADGTQGRLQLSSLAPPTGVEDDTLLHAVVGGHDAPDSVLEGPRDPLEEARERFGIEPEDSDDEQPQLTATLMGQLHACSHCGSIESTPGVYKKCSQCYGPRYCSRKCQKAAWKAGHKHECGEGSMRDVEGAAEVVVFPGDASRRPYAVRIPHVDWPLAAEHIGVKLLGCASPSELKCEPAMRGDTHHAYFLRVCHRKVNDLSRLQNPRACTLLTSLDSQPPLIDEGEDNPAVRVRGDAVIVRLAMAPGESADGPEAPRLAEKIVSYTYDDYDKNYGIFQYFQLPGSGKAMGSLFQNTKEGQKAQRDALQMMQERLGLGTPSA